MLQRALSYVYACSVILTVGCARADLNPGEVTTVKLGQVTNEAPGTFQPHGGRCQASLQISPIGGGRALFITHLEQGQLGKSIEDVSGIVWVTADSLVFSVSPIYGKPGIFIFSCSTAQVRRIVEPKTFKEGYPDGADYFELHSVSDESGGKIRFYYAPDAGRVDFHQFRTKSFLFEVGLDGSEFRQVSK